MPSTKHSVLLFTVILISSICFAAERPRWALHYSYTVSPGIVQTVLADMNNDGKLDEVLLLRDNNTQVYKFVVLLGNGNGTFQSPKYTSLPGFTFKLAIANVNRDGKRDVIALGENKLLVFLGNGDGTFLAAKDTNLPEVAIDFVAADLNNDGYPDVVAGNSVMMGDGSGTFKLKAQLPIPSLTAGTLLGDIKRDGKNDLVIFVGDVGPLMYSFVGNGDGTFTLKYQTSFGFYGVGPIYLTDLNNDGKLDLVMGFAEKHSSGSCQDDVGVQLGNGDGSFQTPQFFSDQCMQGSVGLGDVTGDKKYDLVVGGRDLTTGLFGILTFLNDGTGHFGTPKLNTSLHCNHFLLGDLDGDGKADLLCDTDTGTQVGLARGDGTYSSGVTTVNNPAVVAALSDITRDTAKDAVLKSDFRLLTLVNLSGTNVTPSTSPTSLVYKQPFTVKATVTPSITPNVSTPPSGTVVFKNGTTSLGSAAVGANLSVPSGLSVGTRTLTAAYGGDFYFNPHTVSFTRVVSKATSHASLTSSANPSIRGHSVTITAKVYPQYAGGPTGKITFKDGSTTLATVTLSSATATYTTSSFSAGTHSITAIYSGDGNFFGSTSAVLTQQVN